MNSSLEDIRNKKILSACSPFEKLPKHRKEFGTEIAEFENFTIVVKMVKEKECFHILDLLDKIMITLNEITWESITLPAFKYWCDLLLFTDELSGTIEDGKPSENLTNLLDSVNLKVYRFFFRGLIHFRKMNIKIVDANNNAPNFESSVVSRTEKFLMHSIERIKNYETIQDLIDDSPTAECPVCMDVMFTESTKFHFRISCNHLVCHSCVILADKFEHELV